MTTADTSSLGVFGRGILYLHSIACILPFIYYIGVTFVDSPNGPGPRLPTRVIHRENNGIALYAYHMYLCCGYPEKRRAGKNPEKDEPDYRYRWPTQQTLISQESDDVQTKLDKALRAVGQPLLWFHPKTEPSEQKGGSQESGPEVRVPKRTAIFGTPKPGKSRHPYDTGVPPMATTVPAVAPEVPEVPEPDASAKAGAKKGWKRWLHPLKTTAKVKPSLEPEEPSPGNIDQQDELPHENDQARARSPPLKKWRWPPKKPSELQPEPTPSTGLRQTIDTAGESVDEASQQGAPAASKKAKVRRQDAKKLVKPRSDPKVGGVPVSGTPRASPAPDTVLGTVPGSKADRLVVRVVAGLKNRHSKPRKLAGDNAQTVTDEAEQRETPATETSSPAPPPPEKARNSLVSRFSRPNKASTVAAKARATTPLASVPEDPPAEYRCSACGHRSPAGSPLPRAAGQRSPGPTQREGRLHRKPRRSSGSG